MSDKLTSEDFANAMLSPCLECLEEIGCDLKWRMLKWKSLSDAKKVKAQFSKEDDDFKYSKKLDDNTTQARAMENISKIASDYPAEKRQLTGPGGGPIVVTDLDLSEYTDDELRIIRGMAARKHDAGVAEGAPTGDAGGPSKPGTD